MHHCGGAEYRYPGGSTPASSAGGRNRLPRRERIFESDFRELPVTPSWLCLHTHNTMACTVIAPPGATFLTNPRSTVDFPQPVTGVQKNGEILNVRHDGWGHAQPTPGFFCVLWPARVVYRRFLGRNPADQLFMVMLGHSEMCHTPQFRDLSKF